MALVRSTTRRTQRRHRRAVASVLVVAVTLASGCGQGFDRLDAVESFQRTYPESSDAEAGCVVDRLLDGYSLVELQTELAAEPLEADFEEAQFRDMFACGLEGDVGDQIAAQLVDNGVDAEAAPCVADALVDDMDDADIDVLLSGEITDQFYEKFFTAMESCGAVSGTVGG